MKLKFNIVVCLVFGLSLACSRTLPPLDKKTAVSRDKSIFIVGLDWVESYNDLKKHEEKTRTGYEYYLARGKIIEENNTSEKEKDVPRLNLTNFKLSIDGTELGDKQIVFYRPGTKFNKFQAYGIMPQTFSLQFLYFTGELLQIDFNKDENDRFHETQFKIKLPVDINVALEQGNVYYLGTVKVYIKTEKQWFGLFPPQIVNKSMQVFGFEIIDEFDEMQTYFQTNENWLPVDTVQNISTPMMYKKIFEGWETADKDFLLGVEKERDKSKFFY